MYRALLKAGTGVALVRLAGMAAGFALTMVLARMLGPEGVGAYGYVVMLLVLIAVPISSGWATVLLRATARAGRDTDGAWSEVSGLMRCGICLALGLALVWFALGFFAQGFIGLTVLGVGTLALLAVILFVDQTSALRLAVLRGLDYPVWGQIPEMLIRPILILLFFLLFTTLRSGVPELVDAILALGAAATLAALAGWGVMWFKSPAALRNARPETYLCPWLRSAALLSGNAGLVILNSQTDFLMLGFLGTTEELGHYRVAMQIALLSGFVYIALNMIAIQRFAHLLSTGETEALQRIATFLARLAFLGALPLLLVFWGWGEVMLLYFFGPGFEASHAPLLWLLGSQVLNAAMGFTHSVLLMGGYEGHLLRFTVLSVVLNILLCLVLIPRFGLVGAGLASFLAQGAWNLVLFSRVFQLIGIDSSILGTLKK